MNERDLYIYPVNEKMLQYLLASEHATIPIILRVPWYFSCWEHIQVTTMLYDKNISSFLKYNSTTRSLLEIMRRGLVLYTASGNFCFQQVTSLVLDDLRNKNYYANTAYDPTTAGAPGVTTWSSSKLGPGTCPLMNYDRFLSGCLYWVVEEKSHQIDPRRSLLRAKWAKRFATTRMY